MSIASVALSVSPSLRRGLYLALVLVCFSVYVGATAVARGRVGRLWHLTNHAGRLCGVDVEERGGGGISRSSRTYRL